jgi:nucleoside-diphosphate-sugar epimerase
MKILVTGAAGFLGRALVERLLANGERDLVLFVRPGSRRADLERIASRHPGAAIEWCVGTLTSPDDCRRAVRGVELIHHLAAGTGGAAADLFLHTVVASKNLLEAVVAEGRRPRIVLVSSFGVYGVATQRRGARIDEDTPLEPHPERRDLYSHAKLRQERLFWDWRERHGLPLVVVRPGVIYGPGGTAISSRVGLNLFGVFLHLGRRNVLPLTYVDNCAEAIVRAGRSGLDGQAYNVVDDDLPTCAEYLSLYRQRVAPLRTVRLPYLATLAMSALVERYHHWSRGQLPAVFTPYKTRTTWGGNRFSNAKLKSIGWSPIVATDRALEQTLASLRVP